MKFIDFLRTRGIAGFAIGFILGQSISIMVGSFVADIINPIIGAVSGSFGNLSSQTITVATTTFTNYATISYGRFIVTVINFIVLALVVYFIFKEFRLERFDKPGDKK